MAVNQKPVFILESAGVQTERGGSDILFLPLVYSLPPALPLSRQTDTRQLLKLFPSGAQAASVSLSISALRLPDFYFYPLFRRDGGSRQTERRVHEEDKRRRQLMGDTVFKLKSTLSRRHISWILTAELQVLMLIHLDGYESRENHPLRCFFFRYSAFSCTVFRCSTDSSVVEPCAVSLPHSKTKTNCLPSLVLGWILVKVSAAANQPTSFWTLSMLHYSATLNPKSCICNYKIKEGPTEVADWKKKKRMNSVYGEKKKWHFTDTLPALMMSLSTLLRTHSL